MRGRMSQLRKKLHVWDDKWGKIGYNKNNRAAQQINVVQSLFTFRENRGQNE